MQFEISSPAEANNNALDKNPPHKKAQHRKPLAVTVKEAEELIGIGHTKFYELIRTGIIKTFTVGRRRLVVYASLEELANA